MNRPHSHPQGRWLAWTLSALFGLLALLGCRTRYVPVAVQTTDSIVVRDTLIDVQLVPYRDSVVVVPEAFRPDSAASFLSNPYGWSWARWTGGRLHHSLGIWPDKLTPIRVPYYMERVRRVEVPKVVEVEKKLTRWQQIKLEAGGLAIGGCGVLMVLLAWYIVRSRRL